MNKLVNDSFTASKVCKNKVLVLASIEAIASVKVAILAVISTICFSSGRRRSSTAANSAAAARFTGPILSSLRLSSDSSVCSFCTFASDKLRPWVRYSVNTRSALSSLLTCFSRSPASLIRSLAMATCVTVSANCCCCCCNCCSVSSCCFFKLSASVCSVLIMALRSSNAVCN